MQHNDYNESGYIHFENFFAETKLQETERILKKFHKSWLAVNAEGYKNGSINSHSITSGEFINEQERLALFRFITQEKIKNIVDSIFPEKAVFLNTQLFFDPFNPLQQNYWHRDIQYTGLSIDDQKEAIQSQNVVHFRIPFKPELGIELVPGTHKNWDLPEELETRLSLNGHKSSDSLERGKVISLDRGDLLVFSANMIHRGLYGRNRFSFDIIFCDDTPDFKEFIDPKNQPSPQELDVLDRQLFLNNP
ncbi:Phytanoyl-CoA dioxygenase (PhyH) [Elizabethkingia miricola]|nr:Phytanoyl-CoA dioxygenase (PhyH) [Elizabethkingia miricola]